MCSSLDHDSAIGESFCLLLRSVLPRRATDLLMMLDQLEKGGGDTIITM
jgi:hypothetical protein